MKTQEVRKHAFFYHISREQGIARRLEDRMKKQVDYDYVYMLLG